MSKDGRDGESYHNDGNSGNHLQHGYQPSVVGNPANEGYQPSGEPKTDTSTKPKCKHVIE